VNQAGIKEVTAMKKVRYKVSIQGLPTPRGAISFNTLRTITAILSQGAERALRLAIEGQSVKKGPAPVWLAKATDFILTGIKRGSTTLVVDAATLGEVAHDQISQMDFWHTPPKTSDTALTILSQSLHDASSGIVESERYDSGILETLLDFKQLLRNNGALIKLTAEKRSQESFVLDKAALNNIQKLKQATPPSHAVLVSGLVDAIEHSKKRFQLTMKNGETVRGQIDERAVSLEQMRKFWGQKVTIQGVLHYKASGKPRFLEAQMIDAAQPGDGILEMIKAPQSPAQIWAQVKSEIAERNLVAEIAGKWPGDESIEEILDALKQNRATN
jgi:type II secretory pathway component PulJ